MWARPLLRSLARSNRGAALVEFAIILPLLLLLFGVIIEGGRLMWSYQTAIAGVRDAARYLARVAPSDICGSGGTLTDYVSAAELAAIVRDSINGDSVLPASVQLDQTVPPGVTASLTCVGSVGDFRVSPAPIATVSAQVRIDFPFRGIFDFAADGIEPFVVTTITDRSRVFGA